MLTREQFQSARAAGFSAEKIIELEKLRESKTLTPKPSESGVSEFGKGLATGTLRTLPSLGLMGKVGQALPQLRPITEIIQRMPAIQGKTLPEYSEGVTSELESMPRPTTLGGKLARGVGEVAPLLATIPVSGTRTIAPALSRMTATRFPQISRVLAKPIVESALSLGGYESGREALQGQGLPEVAQSGAGGALTGSALGLGGRLGATLAPRGVIGQRIGTAIGSGIAGGALPMPKEERVSGALLGAGLGALTPGKPYGRTPMEKATQLGRESVNIYRDILRPEKGEVKNIEVRQGKDLDNFYKIAADEGLPIGKTADNKIDTTEARDILSSKLNNMENTLQEYLISKPQRQISFDLLSIGKTAKQKLRGMYKNDTEYKSAVKDVDELINDAVEARGRFLTGSDLNDFKRGMWSLGYNAMKPTQNKVSRQLGRIAREMIEKKYTDKDIKNINEQIGKYSTLEGLLENAQGRVIKSGRLGGMFARTIGAISGSNIPIVGPIAGAAIGGKVSQYITDPARLSQIAAKKAQSAKKFKKTK